MELHRYDIIEAELAYKNGSISSIRMSPIFLAVKILDIISD